MAANTKPGPKTRCKPELILAIAAEIEQGASIGAACGAEGLDDGTLRTWRTKAAEGIEPYATILAPLKKAVMKAIAAAEMCVYLGGTNWQSSARWLESMKPDPWRRTKRRELAGAGDEPIAVDVHLGEELMRKVLKAAGKPGVPGLTPQGLPDGGDCRAR